MEEHKLIDQYEELMKQYRTGLFAKRATPVEKWTMDDEKHIMDLASGINLIEKTLEGFSRHLTQRKVNNLQSELRSFVEASNGSPTIPKQMPKN